MQPIGTSTPILTVTLAMSYLVTGITSVSIAARQRPPDPRTASATTTATGCLRMAEDAGTYVLTATSIDQPGSDTREGKEAARARPPQQTEVRPTVPGGEQAPEAIRARTEQDARDASDVSLRLIFGRDVDASRYEGQRVEVKGQLERLDHRHGEINDAKRAGTRAGTAGSTETTGQTGSVSATGQRAQPSSRAADLPKAASTEPLLFRVESVRTLSPRCEDAR